MPGKKKFCFINNKKGQGSRYGGINCAVLPEELGTKNKS
jgi:hypothetical protein